MEEERERIEKSRRREEEREREREREKWEGRLTDRNEEGSTRGVQERRSELPYRSNQRTWRELCGNTKYTWVREERRQREREEGRQREREEGRQRERERERERRKAIDIYIYI